MTSQEGSSLLKSCARRSFFFARGNLQGFATYGWTNTVLMYKLYYEGRTKSSAKMAIEFSIIYFTCHLSQLL